MGNVRNVAYYDFVKNNDLKGVADTGYRVEIASHQVKDSDQLAEYGQTATTFTETDLKAAFSLLVSYLRANLHSVRRLHIDGLGSFSLKLKAPRVMSPTENIGSKIRVASISFRPDRKLVRYIDNDTTFHRTTAPRTVRSAVEGEALVARLQTYFTSHRFIRTRDVASLAACGHTKALALIANLVEQGVIKNVGTPRQPLYEAGETLQGAAATD